MASSEEFDLDKEPVSAAPRAPAASGSKKKYLALAAASAALLGIVVGLGAGLGTQSDRAVSASQAVGMVTVEECLAREEPDRCGKSGKSSSGGGKSGKGTSMSYASKSAKSGEPPFAPLPDDDLEYMDDGLLLDDATPAPSPSMPAPSTPAPSEQGTTTVAKEAYTGGSVRRELRRGDLHKQVTQRVGDSALEQFERNLNEDEHYENCELALEDYYGSKSSKSGSPGASKSGKSSDGDMSVSVKSGKGTTSMSYASKSSKRGSNEPTFSPTECDEGTPSPSFAKSGKGTKSAAPTPEPTPEPTTKPTSGCSLDDPGTFCCVDADCVDNPDLVSPVCELGNCLEGECDITRRGRFLEKGGRKRVLLREKDPNQVIAEIVGDDCCENSDCDAGETCVQRTCANEGDPRFTLSWTGDDDLDLHVITPGGAQIAWYRESDPISGGVLDLDDIPGIGSTDRWVENIYFPIDGSAPLGEYTFWVYQYSQNDPVHDPADPWTVAVYTNGVLQDSYSGVGDSHPGECDDDVCTTGYKFTK